MRMNRIIVLLLAVFATVVAGESWSLPRVWAGKKVGSTDGNPLGDNAGPRWRIDQVYPDKPEVIANWKPMVWAEIQKQQAWFNDDGSQGGHPRVAIEKSQLKVGVYSKAVNMDWVKVPAIVFIAPRDGTYKFVQESQAKNFEGTGEVDVRFFRIDRANKTVEAAGSSICGSTEPRRGESRPVKLAKGDELAASFWAAGHHSGATVTVTVGVTTAKPAE